MAYRTPVFNVWCKVRRETLVAGVPTVTFPGYSLCQVRGPKAGGAEIINAICFEILFPKWSDVRYSNQNDTIFGDWVQVAGWGNRWAQIVEVCDKGAGFTNEYRLTSAYFVDYSTGVGSLNTVLGCGVVDPTLMPPGGFTPLPLLPKLGWV